MRLIALLSWYDEPLEDLVACIASAAQAGVDHVVAVDGAYALYPGGQARSHVSQTAAIVTACRELDLGLTIHTSRTVWEGGEVEKRTFHFALALAVSEPGDWFWIMDADEVIVDTPPDLKDRLEATELECADIMARDTFAVRVGSPDLPDRFSVRHLFKAQPIRVSTNHITYVTSDGRLLWGYEGGGQPLEDALDLTECVLLDHRPERRSQERQLAKYQYYQLRNAARIERGDCEECGKPAAQLVPVRWRMTDLGPVADWMEACEACCVTVGEVNRVALSLLGVDPDRIEVVSQMGRAPQAA